MQAKYRTPVFPRAAWLGLMTWMAVTSAAAQPGAPVVSAAPGDETAAVPAAAGAGSRCVQGQDGSALCLQRLQQDASGALRAFLTYMTPSQEVKLVDAPVLTVDNVKLPLGSAAFADTAEPLSVVTVIQLAGRPKDKEAFPTLKQGLEHLLKTVATLRQARIGLLGYNVSRIDFQPNVELGDVNRLPAVVQALQLPEIKLASFELHEALADAVTSLEHEPASRRKQILVFTDGSEKAFSRTQLFQKLARRANQGDIVVSAVMLPSLKEPNDFLRSLVDSTGGGIRRSRDVQGLGVAFDASLTELTRQTVATFPTDRLSLVAGHRVLQVQLAYGSLVLRISWPIEWRSPAPANKKGQELIPTETGMPVKWMLLAASGVVVLLGGVILLFWRRGSRSPGVTQVRRATPPRLPAVPAVPPAPPVSRAAEVTVERTVPPPSPGRPPGKQSAVCWLYEVRRQRTHLVDRFPFKVGNDLDCDLVLGGLGEPVTVATLSSDGQNFYLQLQAAGRPARSGKLLGRREVLSDRAEFAVGSHRLVIFETPLTD